MLKIQQKWRELYDLSNDCKVFQSFEWNYEWYSRVYKNNTLFIIVIFDSENTTPIAICPTMIDSKKCLRFIADKHSDYCNFLIDSKIKSYKYYEVIKKIAKAIQLEPAIKNIELKNISQTNRHIGFFSSFLDFKKIVYQENATSYKNMAPKDNLFKNFDYLSSKQRSELKRLYKKHSNFECKVYDVDTQEFPRGKIEEIVKEMVLNDTRDTNFLNETLLDIIESLYNKGTIIISSLTDRNNETYAMNFIMESRGESVYLFWLDIYRNVPYINLSSYLYFIEWLTLNRKYPFTIDFGRGLYDYKVKNFIPEIKLQFSLFHAKNSIDFIRYLVKLSTIMTIKNFYKKNKSLINRILCR